MIIIVIVKPGMSGKQSKKIMGLPLVEREGFPLEMLVLTPCT